MIHGIEERKRDLAFEFQNSRVSEKRSISQEILRHTTMKVKVYLT